MTFDLGSGAEEKTLRGFLGVHEMFKVYPADLRVTRTILDSAKLLTQKRSIAVSARKNK